MGKCEQCGIRQLNAFKELTKDELIRLSLCKSSKEIKKGEVLFDEGEHINGLYCVRNGVCKVSKMSDNGKDQIINLIKKGDLIGERSLISNESSNLKAVALNDVEVCFIPKEEVIKNLQRNPNFTMGMMQKLALSLKNADNIIVDMAQKTVKQRLAVTLLYLHENFKTEEGINSIHLTREDIANIIGTATESAIRLLSEFKKNNLIDLKGKEIFVLNIPKLKILAEGL
ncbi:Crp/Fnr family transcriptional regulator [Tenacibaculum sp. IB213877]|uniref:Crp/Fnr family transcriptional regulator n=1 Tax=Tenacibaculum sp. IB213877 TaxID=3097351 RepID=UPI002A5AEAB0|nr:Crp/Fnr family transcriptional regulator [Tenacibaculum sp. IB213877]MDY0781415.1 Crp/Fnr family transcriptional regulator [Tenacibaculum sp. IB213877]